MHINHATNHLRKSMKNKRSNTDSIWEVRIIRAIKIYSSKHKTSPDMNYYSPKATTPHY